jgi:hypothetical protein
MQNKKFIAILIFTVVFLVFAWPKEMNQDNICLGWSALLADLNNPFSYISEELATRIEIETIYQVCFGIPF